MFHCLCFSRQWERIVEKEAFDETPSWPENSRWRACMNNSFSFNEICLFLRSLILCCKYNFISCFMLFHILFRILIHSLFYILLHLTLHLQYHVSNLAPCHAFPTWINFSILISHVVCSQMVHDTDDHSSKRVTRSFNVNLDVPNICFCYIFVSHVSLIHTRNLK